jgi:hypothetical protein
MTAFSLDAFQRFIKTPDFEAALEYETTPGLENWLMDREQYEASLVEMPTGSPGRINEFVYVIDRMQYMSEYHLRRSSSQSLTALVQLGLVISLVGSSFALAGYAGGIFAWLWYLSAISMVAACIYRMTAAAKNSQAAVIEPLLVRSFAELKPSRAELQLACERLSELSVSRLIRPQRLLDEIDRYNQQDMSIRPSSAHPR